MVRRGCRSPCRLIADNAGIEGEVIVQALQGKAFEMGYNAMDDKVEDLIAAGVIDPAKVPVTTLVYSTRLHYVSHLRHSFPVLLAAGVINPAKVPVI